MQQKAGCMVTTKRLALLPSEGRGGRINVAQSIVRA